MRCKVSNGFEGVFVICTGVVDDTANFCLGFSSSKSFIVYVFPNGMMVLLVVLLVSKSFQMAIR